MPEAYRRDVHLIEVAEAIGVALGRRSTHGPPSHRHRVTATRVTASLPLSGYFTTEGFARDHATALRGFQGALNQAKENTAQFGTVQAVLRTLPGMSSRDASLVTIGQYPAFLSVGQVQRVADLMYSTGMITNTVPVKNLIFK